MKASFLPIASVEMEEVLMGFRLVVHTLVGYLQERIFGRRVLRSFEFLDRDAWRGSRQTFWYRLLDE